MAHLDNTFSAFMYLGDGRVEVDPALDPDVKKIASAIREMAGILRSPAKARKYAALGIAYDGTSKRKEHWEIVSNARRDYISDPKPERASAIAKYAPKLGYFSIWMKAFEDRPEVRLALIKAFKADPTCLDANGLPVKKGRV